MRFTLSWLKQFLNTDASLEKITHTLTMIGLEVEDVDDRAKDLEDFEVAEIMEAAQHPDADKLKVCSVKTRSGLLQIVCGAPNARPGIKVVLANVGTLIPNGNFKIKKSNIRGVESVGMLCSAEEIGLSGIDSKGILELDGNAIIGDNVAKYLGVDDPVIHINITPNRADALGVYGIARDLAASGIGTLKDLEIEKTNISFDTNITLENKNQIACPFFAIREIRGIQNKESPNWLKSYLNNIGVGSISAIVDITNYISYTFGQPMHAYDADKLAGELIVETLKEKTNFNALNNKEYELDIDTIIIRDNSKIHCVGGIIGGINSACSENTKNIVLEAASFNPEYIAKSGRKLQIDTDSRYRFERNVDSEFTEYALEIATNLILSICGGAASQIVSRGNAKLPTRDINFSADFLKSKTNLDLSEEKITDILVKLGFVCSVSDEIINIMIPSWRYDVSIKEDIVEEIVRIYGYDNLPEIALPAVNISRTIPKDYKRISDIKRLLASCGYTEIVTWSFMDSKKAALFSEIRTELGLQNPISSDLDYMRPSIIPNLLKAACSNLNRSFYDFSLFEVGPIFRDTSDKVANYACGIRVGKTFGKNNHNDSRSYDVFDVKADIAVLLELVGLDINRCQIKTNAPSYYHPTRSASILLGKNIVGYFGQIHPLVLTEFAIEVDVIAFELDVSNLPYGKNKFGKKSEYTTSDYQKIIRDYAFIVNANQSVGEMLSLIRNIDKDLIKSVDLFDIYSGDKIGNGKKSIALSVSIQDDHKTLGEAEIEKIHDLIIESISKRFNAVIRS
jgi:phenylalanyl-tRNA synthetase beta chain